MKASKAILLVILCAAPALALVIAGEAQKQTQPNVERILRGKYLVSFGGCNDCHTPVKFTDKGPVSDYTRMLSGHPEDIKLPPPKLMTGSWCVASADMTEWAGPWGISYAANLTPDENTGLGIWTEDMFVKTMRTGRHMSVSRKILPPMTWQNLNALTDEDLKAVYAYLRTIPAVTNHVPEATGPDGDVDLQ